MSVLSHAKESLSNRELEVAAAYAKGQSYKEIARSLSISPTTVRTHLRTVYSKLGVTSKIELVHRLTNTAEPESSRNLDNSALISELALELDEAFRREKILANVLRIISHQGDHLDTVIDKVLDHALEICDAEFGILFEYHGDLSFRAMRSRNISAEFERWLDEQDLFTVQSETGLGRVATTLSAVNITDVRGEDIYQEQAPLRMATADLGKARSFAAIPMMSGDQLIGAFTVYRTRVHPFNERSLEHAQLFADQASIAIENARNRVNRDSGRSPLIATGHTIQTSDGNNNKIQPRLLAVLPFRCVDEDDEDLSKTGHRLSASITMELSSSPLFRLVDQASSFSHTLRNLSPVDAADKLVADIIASGSIRRVASGGFRVATWLHQSNNSTALWTERFDSQSGDTGLLLENLLSRLCAAIGTSVERQMVSAAQASHSSNQSAMDHFLQGLELHHRQDADSFLDARGHFERALRKDPDFGRAAAALAITHVREWFLDSGDSKLLDIADQHSRIAIGIAPHDAWAQTVWGVVALYKKRHLDAELSFKRAMELTPYDTYVVSRCGLGKFYNGDFEEAETLFRHSIDLDPLHPDRNRGFLGHTLFHLDRHEEAIALLSGINQPLSWEFAWLAACYAATGESKMANATADRFRASFNTSDQRYLIHTRPFRHEVDLQRLFDGMQSAGISDGLIAAGK
ncbi:MAG: DNA-binding CsgD family transcriptional regulator/TolB-like protein/Tfp pilus assembly protein PilF [Parasphingorhabdus sp.]